jgi:hypothetical protein
LHKRNNELHLLQEISIPGGNVDYFLASVKQKKIIDFIGIEIQTLDTTGSPFGAKDHHSLKVWA